MSSFPVSPAPADSRRAPASPHASPATGGKEAVRAALFLAALALMLCPLSASAQPFQKTEGASGDGGRDAPAAAPMDALGSEEPVPEGPFLEVQAGASMAFGGIDPADGSQSPSSPSLVLKLSAGYEFTRHLEAGGRLSLSSVSNRCMGSASDSGHCIESASDWSLVSGDFTAFDISAFAAWKHPLTERFLLVGQVAIGWTFLTPRPLTDASGSFSVSASAGILWATPLSHFSIGISLGWNFLTAIGLHQCEIVPRLRYNF